MMKLVCIGDSLTYGYGVKKDLSFVELLRKHLNINIVNKGINGDTTSGILSRSYEDVLKEKPDYVLIMAGTNDLLMNRSLSLIEDNIKLLIKEAKDNGIIPILALQPPIIASLAKIYWDSEIDYENVNLNLSKYINYFKTYLKDNNIHFIDFYNKFLSANNITNLFSDGIHPNVEGHKLMFNTISKNLTFFISNF